jgi:hypothetical protein
MSQDFALPDQGSLNSGSAPSTQPGLVKKRPKADVGCLAASSVGTAVRAIANCGWSRYAALTV